MLHESWSPLSYRMFILLSSRNEMRSYWFCSRNDLTSWQGVPESVVWLNLNSGRGDFVSVWSRRVLDWPLWHHFQTAWNEGNNNKTGPKLYSLDPAIPRNPLLLSTVRYRAFFRSDHAAFWTHRSKDYDESLSAVLITDMGKWIHENST